MEYCVEHDMTTVDNATENACMLLKREHISLQKINIFRIASGITDLWEISYVFVKKKKN